MHFAVTWLHLLEFAIIAGSIEYLARVSDILALQIFSMINLYIFFMFIFKVVDEYGCKYAQKHLKQFIKDKKKRKYIHITSLSISLFIVVSMVLLILEVVNKHSVTDLLH